MTVIIDFCKNCGAVLRPQVSNCDNCNSDVRDRDSRIQGEFSETEAEHLLDAVGMEPQ